MTSSNAQTAPVQRQPEQAGTSVAFVSGVSRAVPPRGTADFLKAYSSSPMLQAVVRKISMTVARIRWHVGVRDSEGTFVRLPDHPAARLLNGGVPGLDGFQCKMVEQQYLELVGEAFALLERGALGVPVRRYPIPPSWVLDVPSPFGGSFEVRGSSGTRHRLPLEDVLWYKDVDPANPYQRGSGIARALGDELATDEAAAKHAASSLVNRARPDVIVSGSKELPLSREAAERLLQVWEERFGGPQNAAKPFVSLGPVDVKTLTPSFKELTLTNLREFERDMLISVFGVPPEIMGVIENSNRATIESAEFLFMKHVVLPRLEARAAAIRDQLLPQYDSRLEVEFDPVVQEDREYQLRVMSARPEAFSLDEYRVLAGVDPLPGDAGDVGSVPGLAFARVPQEVLASVQAMAAAVRRGELTPEGARRLAAASFPTLDEGTINSVFPDSLAPPAGGNTPEPQTLAARQKGLTQAQVDELVASLDGEPMEQVMVRNSRAIMAEFGEGLLEGLALEISFDLTSDAVLQFLEDLSANRVSMVNETTRRALRSALAEGVGAGESIDGLARRIRVVMDEASEVRAQTIARTETVRASNFGVKEAMAQAGVTEKEWLATLDSRTRDSHREMDGQRVPADQPFRSPAGFTAMFPGDFGIASEDINCRCSVVVPDSLPTRAARKSAFDQIEQRRALQEGGFIADVQRAFRAQRDRLVEQLRRIG